MNLRLLTFVLGEIAIIIGALMCIPLFMAVGYGEDKTILAFGIAIAVCLVLGIIGIIVRPSKDKRDMRSSSGFAMCGLFWIVIALISAIPYRVSGYIPHYIDALFETISGYTTTGSSILRNVELLPKSLLFWRALTQFIGGMGVLVFVIALIPKNDKMSTALAKAEVPGPQFGKLVSKLRFTSMILYAIYIVMTLLLIGILCAQKMPVFDSFCTAFSAASTGGFGVKADSIAYYNSVGIEVTLTVFMLLFSVNFNVFYLIIVGHFIKAVRNEELFWFFGIYACAVAVIVSNLCLQGGYAVGQAFRDTTFTAASVISTTGFGTADFTRWPQYSQSLIVILMLIGAMAGSTGGGIKLSRMLIFIKTTACDFMKIVSPRTVKRVAINGQRIDRDTVRAVYVFCALYALILVTGTLLVSFDGYDMTTNFTAVISCLSNIGPGLGLVGPAGSFAIFSPVSKLIFTFIMLAGRLEFYPMLALFATSFWKK